VTLTPRACCPRVASPHPPPSSRSIGTRFYGRTFERLYVLGPLSADREGGGPSV
jgi:hypothetical protein